MISEAVRTLRISCAGRDLGESRVFANKSRLETENPVGESSYGKGIQVVLENGLGKRVGGCRSWRARREGVEDGPLQFIHHPSLRCKNE